MAISFLTHGIFSYLLLTHTLTQAVPRRMALEQPVGRYIVSQSCCFASTQSSCSLCIQSSSCWGCCLYRRKTGITHWKNSGKQLPCDISISCTYIMYSICTHTYTHTHMTISHMHGYRTLYQQLLTEVIVNPHKGEESPGGEMVDHVSCD